MRVPFLAVLALAGLAMPADAQRRPVYVQPEIRQQPQPYVQQGIPATSLVADLTARIDALEGQLARLTNQVEQDQFRIRQLEEELNRFRDETGARLEQLQRPVAAPEPAADAEPEQSEREPQPARTETTDAPAEDATLPEDPAEADYVAGFRLWDQKRFSDAAAVLEAMAKKYPKHRRASYARNLAGRAYLDDDKPATAAKILLANYQADPKGERAADSLYFLGQALVRLDKREDACKVYDELEDVYGAGMRDFLRERLPAARDEARCGG